MALERTPSQKSGAFLWSMLMLAGGVVLCAGAVAMSLSGTFRGTHQENAYAPTTKHAEQPRDTVTVSSNIIPLPPRESPPLDPELTPKQPTTELALAPPSTNAAEDAIPKTQKDTATTDLDSPATTSAVAPVSPLVSARRETGPSSRTDSATLGVPPTASSLARSAPKLPNIEPQEAQSPSPQGTQISAATPTTTPSAHEPHAVKPIQDSVSTTASVSPKRHAPSEASQKMWYK